MTIIDIVTQKTIEELRKRNPYPKDIFIKPSKEEIKEIYKKVKIEGLIGSEGRRVWDLCCDELDSARKHIKLNEVNKDGRKTIR